MRRLVIMLILYVLDEYLKIPGDNYEIIYDTEINTTFEQIKNDFGLNQISCTMALS